MIFVQLFGFDRELYIQPTLYRQVHDSASVLSLSLSAKVRAPLSTSQYPQTNNILQYSLAGDPASWGSDFSHVEPDDYLHNPDPIRDRKTDRLGSIFTWRGFTNLGCLILLGLCVVTLLYATVHPPAICPFPLILTD